MQETQEKQARGRTPTWFIGTVPLLLLAALVWVFLTYGPLGVFQAAFPPVEELSIQRIVLPEPGVIRLEIINGGPDPVTVAQVLVDEAYWVHTIEPARTIPRLGRATITIPYSWVEGDTHEIILITNTGVTFTGEIAVATVSPRPNALYLRTFTLLGIYVGVIPVSIGLLWFPFLRRIERRWLNFFLALTVGLLLFLGVDAVAEALELAAEQVPGPFRGVLLIFIGGLGTFLALDAFVRWTTSGARDKSRARLVLAYLIALGIGLHNLGEGLAIGAAYAVGEIALGGFLVLGFMIHNTTEGLAIVAPIAKDRPVRLLGHLAAMGALAGGPTIVGTWIGGFSYSPIWATFFLALGAGAIFQVVYEIGKLMRQQSDDTASRLLNVAGLMAGLVIMYVTGLLVTA
ncbi:MAG: ZIP family metal transporter [Chloroflexi bacterium]|nr:ZIP family metal transporter [Chloroflexota bacterium]